MAKACMRPYYALGLLVAGIVILYLFVQNVEPFVSKVPTLIGANKKPANNITSIYLFFDTKKFKLKLINIDNNNGNKVTVKTCINDNDICDIIINQKFKLYDYGIYVYAKSANCTTSRFNFTDLYNQEKNKKKGYCWMESGAQLALYGQKNKIDTDVSSTFNKNGFLKPSDINTFKIRAKDITSKLSGAIIAKQQNELQNGANIRIDLSL